MPCRLKTYISLFLTTCFYAKTTSLVEGYIHHHPFWWALSVYLAMIKYFKGVFVENIWQDSGSWIWYHFMLRNVSWFDYDILYYHLTYLDLSDTIFYFLGYIHRFWRGYLTLLAKYLFIYHQQWIRCILTTHLYNSNSSWSAYKKNDHPLAISGILHVGAKLQSLKVTIKYKLSFKEI